LLILNHNSFRVPFDKIASVYSIWKIYLYFSSGNDQPREPALWQLYRHTFLCALKRGHVGNARQSPKNDRMRMRCQQYIAMLRDKLLICILWYSSRAEITSLSGGRCAHKSNRYDQSEWIAVISIANRRSRIYRSAAVYEPHRSLYLHRWMLNFCCFDSMINLGLKKWMHTPAGTKMFL